MNKKNEENEILSEDKIAKQIGEMLKNKRKEMNISLTGVENAISIRKNYLQAIEDGRFDQLISMVYAQGFIRQYAKFLNVEIEEVLRQNPDLFNAYRKKPTEWSVSPFEPTTSDEAVKFSPNILWMILFLVVLILAWIFARYMGVL